MNSSIIQAVKSYAAIQPEKLCMVDARRELTYAEVWKEVTGVASYLQDVGVKSVQKIVVECTQDTEFVILGLAIQLVGAIFVPLESGASIERVQGILEETEANFYFYKDKLDVSAIKLEYPCEYARKEDVFELPQAEQVAEILFSTGTTGKSKGIVLTHTNNIAVAQNVIKGVEMKKDNIELIPMPLSHSHGLRRYYANMLNGSTVVFMDGVTFVKKVFDNIDKYHITAMDLAPSALDIILKFSKNKLNDYADQFDYIQLGSAPLKEDSKLRLSQLLPKTRLYNFYGSTEAGCSCILDFNKENKPGCIGKPTVNSHFIVVDEDKKEIRSDAEHTGFLACKGDMNMAGYYNQPELTKSVMRNGYVYSNDVGYIDEEGYVYMLGRDDDVINYAGIKISPEEIEEVALRMTIVKDCACVPIKDEIYGQAPRLYVVTRKQEESVLVEIKQWLLENLDQNKVPKEVTFIDEIPRTFNGKILRKQLRNLNN